MTKTDSNTRRQLITTSVAAIFRIANELTPATDSLTRLDLAIWHLKRHTSALEIQYEDLKEAIAREEILEQEAAKAELAKSTPSEPDTESIF
ncbi:MAG: hypothetical protein IJE88_04315 [Akkermansia sp.]|nr:hypothetical protein [Akkermansia sp.]